MTDKPRDPGPGAGEAIRPAATVMLVRDGADGLETFVLRRVSAMAFAAGMTVFPGGGVDAADRDETVGWSGPDPQWWRAALGEDAEPALVVAAVRELFEETGVLLAGRDPAGPVVALDEDVRSAIIDRRSSLARVLADAGLSIRSDLLRPWANWLTPPGQGRRYDTFFFAAALPDGQRARMLTTEADLGEWRRPADVLAERGGRRHQADAADHRHAAGPGGVRLGRSGAGGPPGRHQGPRAAGGCGQVGGRRGPGGSPMTSLVAVTEQVVVSAALPIRGR